MRCIAALRRDWFFERQYSEFDPKAELRVIGNPISDCDGRPLTSTVILAKIKQQALNYSYPPEFSFYVQPNQGDQIMKAILLRDDEALSFTVFGWTLTTPPPSITAAGIWQPTPTDLVPIQTAKSHIVPTQTITPTNLSQPNLSVTSSPGDDDVQYWYIDVAKNYTLELELKMILPANVTLEMIVAAVGHDNKAPTAHVNVIVNGTRVCVLTETDDHWHNANCEIDGNYLNQGTNTITLSASSGGGIWVKSITVSSIQATINASYFWKQIGANEVFPGLKYSQATTYEEGSTSSTTATNTFAESIGVTIKIGGIESLLTGLSAQISTSFTARQSTAHTVSISSSITKSTMVTVTCPPGDKSNTFQVWQCCLQYEAKGNLLVQALGGDFAPFPIVREFRVKS